MNNYSVQTFVVNLIPQYSFVKTKLFHVAKLI